MTFKVHSNPKNSRIALNPHYPRAGWDYGAGYRVTNITSLGKATFPLKTTVVIHEELGLFTEPLFAASDLGVFTGVEANLGGVVVSA